MDQFPPLLQQFADGDAHNIIDFFPTPNAVRQFCRHKYRAARTLILQYESDGLDESQEIETLFKYPCGDASWQAVTVRHCWRHRCMWYNRRNDAWDGRKPWSDSFMPMRMPQSPHWRIGWITKWDYCRCSNNNNSRTICMRLLLLPPNIKSICRLAKLVCWHTSEQNGILWHRIYHCDARR